MNPNAEKPVIYLSFANDTQNILPALDVERTAVHGVLSSQTFLEAQQALDLRPLGSSFIPTKYPRYKLIPSL